MFSKSQSFYAALYAALGLPFIPPELRDDARACNKIRQLSVAELLAETIRRITDGDSVTSLFSEQNNNF